MEYQHNGHVTGRRRAKTARLDSRRPNYWPFCYFIVGLTSGACYVNNTRGQFVHDDVRAVVTNPDVRGIRPLLEAFRNDFWGKPMSDATSHKSYCPLCVVTFRLNELIAPGNPAVYHITNNILHIMASVLFTHMCRNVIFSGDMSPSVTAGLFFAVCPIHTEAVSGVVGRADIMCCIFYLLCLITYHRCDQTTSDNTISLMCPLFYATLSLLSKEQGVTVLGVCLLYEVFTLWQLYRRQGIDVLKKSSSLKKITIKVLSLSLSSVFLVMFRLWMLRGSFPKFQEEDNPAAFAPLLPTRALTYAYLWAFNFWLILCPIKLSHDWQMGSISLVETVWDSRNTATLFSIGVLFSLTWSTISCNKVRDGRRMFFGLVLTVLPFLLVSNIFVTVGFVLAERVLYMPSMGVSVLVTTGIEIIKQSIRNHSRLIQVLVTIFGVLLPACRTVIRNQAWLSRENLAKSGLQVLPNNAKMHYNYANLLAERGHLEKAMNHYQKAISLWPSYASAHNNLAHHMDNKTEALIHLAEVIKLQPCHANAYTNIANIYHSTFNNTEEAMGLLRLAMECEPKSVVPRLSMATIYQQMNATRLAEQHYHAALAVAPTDASVHYNIGVFYEKRGDYQLAVEYLEKALSLDQYNLPCLHALARIYKDLRDYRKTEECLMKILQTRRDQATLDMIGSFYFNIGDYKRSLELFKEAYFLKPVEDVIVHLAQTLAALELCDEAESLLKRHISPYSKQTALIMQLANVLGLKKEHSKAVSLLTKFKDQMKDELSPKELSVIYHQIGNHFKDMNKLYLAFKNYKEAVHFDTDNADSHHNMAVYCHRQGIYQLALHHYQQAINLKPNDCLLQRNYNSLLEKYRCHQTKQHGNEHISVNMHSKANGTSSKTHRDDKRRKLTAGTAGMPALSDTGIVCDMQPVTGAYVNNEAP